MDRFIEAVVERGVQPGPPLLLFHMCVRILSVSLWVSVSLLRVKKPEIIIKWNNKALHDIAKCVPTIEGKYCRPAMLTTTKLNFVTFRDSGSNNGHFGE